MDHMLDRFGRLADRLLDDMDRRLSALFEYEEGSSLGAGRYRVNKSNQGVTITVEVPGLTPADIKVELEDGIVAVHGKGEPVPGHSLVIERKFRVGRSVQPEDIEATVKNGLLVIQVTKPVKTGTKGSVKVTVG